MTIGDLESAESISWTSSVGVLSSLLSRLGKRAGKLDVQVRQQNVRQMERLKIHHLGRVCYLYCVRKYFTECSYPLFRTSTSWCAADSTTVVGKVEKLCFGLELTPNRRVFGTRFVGSVFRFARVRANDSKLLWGTLMLLNFGSFLIFWLDPKRAGGKIGTFVNQRSLAVTFSSPKNWKSERIWSRPWFTQTTKRKPWRGGES